MRKLIDESPIGALEELEAERILNADMKNIETFVDDGGEITIGPAGRGPVACAATAADHHNAVAMLVRRDRETLAALLKRLDKAIAGFYADGKTTDEING